MKYKYSHTLDAFYPADMLDAYADLPTYLINVSEQIYEDVLHARGQGLAYKIADDGASVSIAPSVTHGWDAKKSVWVLNKDKQAAIDEALRKASIPQVVTIRQAKRALLQVELLDDVEAIMASDAVDRATKIDWENATEVEREWVKSSDLMQALGIDDDQLDQLFTLASSM